MSCVADDSTEGGVTFSELGDDLVFSFAACVSDADEFDESNRGQFVQLAMNEETPGYMDRTDIAGIG